MEVKQFKEKKQAAYVTYRKGTDNGDLPGFLLIISWLSDSDRDGWLSIFSIGLLILQHVCMMLLPASTCVFLLDALKGEYKRKKPLAYVHIHTHTHKHTVQVYKLYMYIHVHLHGDLYPLAVLTLCSWHSNYYTQRKSMWLNCECVPLN